MKEVLIFGGTTEGRTLSERLADAGIPHTVCVATEYGEQMQGEHLLVRVRRGRLDETEMRKLMREGAYGAVVDATHPYACAVTANIRQAAEQEHIPCLRLLREISEEGKKESKTENRRICCFQDHKTCAEALTQTPGNILLTTGSKDLEIYCKDPEVHSRLYVRVLPGQESIGMCMRYAIPPDRVIAMQGPFSAELNLALLRQFQIACLVTKASGRTGGYEEKLQAAEQAGIPVYVIGRPAEAGLSFGQVCHRLEEICGKKFISDRELQITLAGIGMGSEACLTREAEEAIREADILLGAERMLAGYQPKIEKKALYRADEILSYLQQIQQEPACREVRRVVVLFSGDSGFYSGSKSLYDLLQKAQRERKLTATIRVLPGISSVSYLAASLGESYQEAAIVSMHGKQLSQLARRVRGEEKLFILTSGAEDVRRLGAALTEAGLTACEIIAGYRLSYPDQQILRLTPRACANVTTEGLYTCMVRNPSPVLPGLTHGTADEAFIRGRVPMTKEEVREISICKLRLHRYAVLYDIGSGTGSIAVEAAALSPDLQVFAVEQNPDAITLIRKNRESFRTDNLQIVHGCAPEVLPDLPPATHAFIGGSKGSLRGILDCLFQINPSMRVVITAISLETICQMREILERPEVREAEVVQVQVSRAKTAGKYHLMQAENPVWICAFRFGGERETDVQ